MTRVSDHPLYARWCGMRARCGSPSHPQYGSYGGRGISVCERWLASFADFVSDMGLPPAPGHSLDRINNDGDYEPGNVRWADAKTQRGNRREGAAGAPQVDGYLRYGDAAKHIGVSRRTLQNYIRDGVVVPECAARRGLRRFMYVSLVELDRFLREGEAA